MHVLVVDDDRMIRELVTRSILEREETASVDVADTLDEARALAMEGSHDAIVLDLGLPDSSGLDTLDAIMDLTPEVPIIVLSGTSNPATIRAALTAGAEDFIVKHQDGTRAVGVRVQNAIVRRGRHAGLEEGHHVHARDQMVRQFLNEANHELRTPLTSIGVAEMLLRDAPLSEDGRLRLQRSLARLKETIEDFLGVLSDPILQDIDLQELVGETMYVDGEPVHVIGNQQALHRAFKALRRMAVPNPRFSTQTFPGDRIRVRIMFQADAHPEHEHPVLLALARQHLEQSMGNLVVRMEEEECRIDVMLNRSIVKSKVGTSARAL